MEVPMGDFLRIHSIKGEKGEIQVLLPNDLQFGEGIIYMTLRWIVDVIESPCHGAVVSVLGCA